MIGRAAAIIAVGVAVILVFSAVFGGGDEYEVTASFENASQVVGGEVVVIGGTQVGLVSKPELGPNGEALIKFTVNDDYAPLRRGTVATARSFSLSGIANRQIQLTLPPDEVAGEPIEDGGTLDQSETVSEVDLDEVFNTLDPETVADLKKVIQGFALSYEGVEKPANKGFRYLNPFLSTSRRVFGELNRDERTFESLIVDSAQLTGALAERRDDVSALIGNLNQMMGALGRQREALATTVRELPNFMRSFNTTAVNLRAALDDVDPLVDASKPVAIKLRPFFAQLRAASADLVPTVRDLDQTIQRPGPVNDLVELTKLQNPLTKIAIGPVKRNGATRDGAFPASVDSLTDGLDELAFFRAYTPELVGWFDDFGHSGVYDANGGMGRISTTFNAFITGVTGAPDILSPIGAAALESSLSTNNLKKCPGANERPAPDGSNPFTDGGTLNCDSTQLPTGP